MSPSPAVPTESIEGLPAPRKLRDPAPEITGEHQKRSVRPMSEAWVAGVCAGLANHLGWSPLLMRAIFVILGAASLIGFGLYFTLWLVMPRQSGPRSAPGLESNARKGLRPTAAMQLTPVDFGSAAALALLGIGIVWLEQASRWALPVPLLIAGWLTCLGLGAIWWHADHASAKSFGDGTGWRRLIAPFLAHWSTVLTVGLGLLAISVSIALVLFSLPGLNDLARTFTLLGLSVMALLLAALPWLLRLREALAQARDAALIADARADMAAHLHDSVLQTLALIQRKAADPKAVTALARRQERELRSWLYGERTSSSSLSEALAAEIIDVEDRHGVGVEIVTVGDCELTPELTAVVGAAREAMVNAAKHSGVDRVDVYAEVDPDLVSVYVRDRGAGFDLEQVDADRMGVRGSILERVRRVGGRAIIRSEPGEGTEVRLELPR